MDVNNNKIICTTSKQLVNIIKDYPFGTLFFLTDLNYLYCKNGKTLILTLEKESFQKPKKAQNCTQCGASLTNEYYCEYYY